MSKIAANPGMKEKYPIRIVSFSFFVISHYFFTLVIS
ncbi:hypothetical protein BL05047 [Bacillus licheniformis DSM 13 = ATCC 14580]|uniref:Uncharacterized protein n=1 Tax=Bacillus licheniformis (strain ATCC 14580 / DSM 13 / JCM 2505 / CCUG 7422 / NBRC 12200 / NCIMB 9375 / NCTC 10341 / NRRL NRS-1264 / Gibson 46) TaxID=279010 RepID=Q62YG1_BACLD|nr:hypothetical protein BL05047 [Bacillus licheniformis DSM 13 = ATCC 14580]